MVDNSCSITETRFFPSGFSAPGWLIAEPMTVDRGEASCYRPERSLQRATVWRQCRKLSVEADVARKISTSPAQLRLFQLFLGNYIRVHLPPRIPQSGGRGLCEYGKV